MRSCDTQAGAALSTLEVARAVVAARWGGIRNGRSELMAREGEERMGLRCVWETNRAFKDSGFG